MLHKSIIYDEDPLSELVKVPYAAKIPTKKKISQIPQNCFKICTPQKIKRQKKFSKNMNNKTYASALLFKKQNIVEQNITCSGQKTRKLDNSFTNIHQKLSTIVKRKPKLREIQQSLSRKTTPLHTISNFSYSSQTNSVNFSKASKERDQKHQIKPSKYFEPKRKQQLFQKIKKDSCQKLLVKNPLNKKSLGEIGLTSYDMSELSSLHKSILKFSKGDVNLSKKAFLVVLNLRGIIIDQSRLLTSEHQFYRIGQFKNFIRLFREVQAHYFKQSTIDYLDILFNRTADEELHLHQILQIFEKRMVAEEARQLYDFIEQKIKEQIGFYCTKIKMNQFYNLCYGSYQICQKINEHFLGNTKTPKNQKNALISNKQLDKELKKLNQSILQRV